MATVACSYATQFSSTGSPSFSGAPHCRQLSSSGINIDSDPSSCSASSPLARSLFLWNGIFLHDTSFGLCGFLLSCVALVFSCSISLFITSKWSSLPSFIILNNAERCWHWNSPQVSQWNFPSLRIMRPTRVDESECRTQQILSSYAVGKIASSR